MIRYVTLALLAPSLALAQSAPPFGRSGLSATGQHVMIETDFAAAMRTKADSTRLDAEIARALAGEAGKANLTDLAAKADISALVPLASSLIAKLDAAETGYVPDTFRQTADGTDDAPSIQRAMTAACGSKAPNLRFRARHYALNSRITQACFVNWLGQGWQEQNDDPASAAGTWFDVGPAFVGSPNSPILITGNSTGSVFQGIGFVELGQPARPTPVRNANGDITGNSPAAFTPAAYAPVLVINGSPGVTVKDVMLLGVNAGLVCVGSGRCSFDNIRGQVFAYMINVQDAYDVSKIRNVHAWPYWSATDPVMAWTQANASVIVSLRNDSPLWDDIFTFGVKNGISIGQGATGSTTGAIIGKISCDFTAYCISVDANVSKTNFMVSSIRSYGEQWITISGHSVTMLPGSSVLHLMGETVAQISNMENFASGLATVDFANTDPNFVSNIHIDSLYLHAGRMPPNTSLVYFPPTPGNLLTVNQLLQTPDAPPGFALSNANPGQTGMGTYQTLTYTSIK